METLVILISAVLPALVLLYFIYTKDKYEKEPVKWLLKGFGFGVLSAFASFLISYPSQFIGLFPAEPVTFEGHVRTALFAAAVPEELAKFYFLWRLLRKNPYYNEYVDGIVYAVCIGMGFAAIENVGYLFDNYEQWASIGLLRAFISIPGHFFFAVTMGFFYSQAAFGDPAKRTRNMLLAVGVPILLHALFDACLMVSDGFGIAGAAFFTFIGLYIYMASKSKKRFESHLAQDQSIRNSWRTDLPENGENNG